MSSNAVGIDTSLILSLAFQSVHHKLRSEDRVRNIVVWKTTTSRTKPPLDCDVVILVDDIKFVDDVLAVDLNKA